MAGDQDHILHAGFFPFSNKPCFAQYVPEKVQHFGVLRTMPKLANVQAGCNESATQTDSSGFTKRSCAWSTKLLQSSTVRLSGERWRGASSADLLCVLGVASRARTHEYRGQFAFRAEKNALNHFGPWYGPKPTANAVAREWAYDDKTY